MNYPHILGPGEVASTLEIRNISGPVDVLFDDTAEGVHIETDGRLAEGLTWRPDLRMLVCPARASTAEGKISVVSNAALRLVFTECNIHLSVNGAEAQAIGPGPQTISIDHL